MLSIETNAIDKYDSHLFFLVESCDCLNENDLPIGPYDVTNNSNLNDPYAPL